jgi:hypothetical protein
MNVGVAARAGTGDDPPAGSGAERDIVAATGRVALGVAVVAWSTILALVLRHRIFVTHDSLINYAHSWWVESQLWHGHGIPWHMPVLGHGEALTFPYGALPWLVAALLWPLFGEWSVTLVLVLGAIGLIGATFWAFPETRRPWWAVVVLANPILVLAPLSGQLPFLWGSALLMVGVGCWRRDRRVAAVVAVSLAQLTHIAVVLPIAALLVLARLRWEPHRRVLIGCYLLTVVVAAPAGWPVVASPVFTDTSVATKLWQFTGTVLIRLFVFAVPLLGLLLVVRRRGRWWPVGLAGVALAANVALLAPLDAGYSWAALGREPDQAMARFVASPQFDPGRTYRLLRTSDGKVGMYQLIRAGGRLDSEFFPESIWGGEFASEQEYSDFLRKRRVDEVLVFDQIPRHVHTNEPQLLARMAASTHSCTGDTVGIRLVYTDDHWDYYAIDHSCHLSSQAAPHPLGAPG